MNIGDKVYNKTNKKIYTITDAGGNGNIVWTKQETDNYNTPFVRDAFITKQELRKMKLKKLKNDI